MQKTQDPRAMILREQLNKARGGSTLVEIVDELAKRALDDEYFTSGRR